MQGMSPASDASSCLGMDSKMTQSHHRHIATKRQVAHPTVGGNAVLMDVGQLRWKESVEHGQADFANDL